MSKTIHLKPQTDQALRYMKREGSISPVQALNNCQIKSLGACVYQLRKAGYEIKSTRLKGQSTRYSLA